MKKNIFIIIRTFFILIICILSLFPFLIVLLSSFNSSFNVRTGNILLGFSVEDFFKNVKTLFCDDNFTTAFKNTFIVTSIAVIIGTIISSISGYSYAILKNRFTNKLIHLYILSIITPSSIIVIPLFIILSRLNLLDNLFMVSITSLSLPFTTYLFKQNTEMFPFELIKLARVDGLSELEIYFKIYIPNMMTTFVTASVLLFFQAWNNFLLPLVIIQSQKNMVLSIFINRYGSSYTTDYGAFMLLLFVSMLPTILLFLLSQKYFFKGIGKVL